MIAVLVSLVIYVHVFVRHHSTVACSAMTLSNVYHNSMLWTLSYSML
jgi:hypothetical protein